MLSQKQLMIVVMANRRRSGPSSLLFGTLNNVGYEVLKNDPAVAVEVFRLNAAEFPQSGNVWDSLAEAYMKPGNLKKAEEYYQNETTRTDNSPYRERR